MRTSSFSEKCPFNFNENISCFGWHISFCSICCNLCYVYMHMYCVSRWFFWQLKKSSAMLLKKYILHAAFTLYILLFVRASKNVFVRDFPGTRYTFRRAPNRKEHDPVYLGVPHRHIFRNLLYICLCPLWSFYTITITNIEHTNTHTHQINQINWKS